MHNWKAAATARGLLYIFIESIICMKYNMQRKSAWRYFHRVKIRYFALLLLARH